jgi:hypothetical protein
VEDVFASEREVAMSRKLLRATSLTRAGVRSSANARRRPRGLLVSAICIVLTLSQVAFAPDSGAKGGFSIFTTSLGLGSVGQAYFQSLKNTFIGLSDGEQVAWSLASGSLPKGLRFDPAGSIAGVPRAAGTSTFTVAGVDTSNGTVEGTAQRTFSLTITSAGIDSVALAGSISNPVVVVWGHGFGTQPTTGITQTGCTSGVANTWYPAGQADVSDTAKNWSAGNVGTTAETAQGSGYGLGILDNSSCGGIAVQSWSDHEVALGQIGAGYPHTMSVGDSLFVRVNGAAISVPVPSLFYGASLGIATTTIGPALVGHHFAETIGALGNAGAITFASTALPAGLSLNATTGIIAGTPTVASTKPVTLTVTDAASHTTSRTLPVTVSAATTMTAASLHRDAYASAFFSKVSSAQEPILVAEQGVVNKYFAKNATAPSAPVVTAVKQLGSFLSSLPALSSAAGSSLPFAVASQLQTGLLTYAQANPSAVIAVAAKSESSSLSSYTGNVGNSVNATSSAEKFLLPSGAATSSAFYQTIALPTLEQASTCAGSSGCAQTTDAVLQGVTGASITSSTASLVTGNLTLSTEAQDMGWTFGSTGNLSLSIPQLTLDANNISLLNTEGSFSLDGTLGTMTSQQIYTLFYDASTGNAANNGSLDWLKEGVDEVSSFTKEAESAAPMLASVIKFVDPAAGDLTPVIKGVIQTVGGIAQLAAGILSDNAMAVIQGAASIVEGIASMFGGTQPSKPDEAAALARQTDGEIQNLGNYVQQQFAQIDTALNTIFTTMSADFQSINWQLGYIGNQLNQIELQLASDQAQLSYLDTEIWSNAQGTIESTIAQDASQCDNYLARFGSPLPYNTGTPNWITCETTLANDAAAKSAQTGVAGGLSQSYTDAQIHELGLVSDPAKVTNLLDLLGTRFPTLFSTAPTQDVNTSDWTVAGQDYAELLAENTNYLTSGLGLHAATQDGTTVYQAGLKALSDLLQLAGQQASDGTNVAVDDVLTEYQNDYAALKASVESEESNVIADRFGGDLGFPLVRQASDLFGGPTPQGYTPNPNPPGGNTGGGPSPCQNGISGVDISANLPAGSLEALGTAGWLFYETLAESNDVIAHSVAGTNLPRWVMCLFTTHSKLSPYYSGSITLNVETTSSVGWQTLATWTGNPCPAVTWPGNCYPTWPQVNVPQIVAGNGSVSANSAVESSIESATAALQPQLVQRLRSDLAGDPAVSPRADAVAGAVELVRASAGALAPLTVSGNPAVTSALYSANDLPGNADQTGNDSFSVMFNGCTTNCMTGSDAWPNWWDGNAQSAETLLKAAVGQSLAAVTANNPVADTGPAGSAFGQEVLAYRAELMNLGLLPATTPLPGQ